MEALESELQVLRYHPGGTVANPFSVELRCHRKGAGNSLTASLIGIVDLPDKELVRRNSRVAALASKINQKSEPSVDRTISTDRT